MNNYDFLRDIPKFRVWHHQLQKFLENDGSWFLDMEGKLKLLEISPIYQGMHDPDPTLYTIDQFTGYIDKYGKNIYKSDFVRFDSGKVKQNIAMVTWYNIFACWGLFTKASFELRNCYNLEVVGNSYQNRELFNHHHQF